MPSSQRAFTLIELLTTIGVVAVLCAVAIPVVNTSKEQARKVDAVNKIRQLGIATRLYVAEKDGRLPGSQHSGNSWVAGLMPYLGLDATNPDVEAMKRVYRSPGDQNKTRLYSYAINDFLLPNPSGARHLDYSRVARLEAPSQTLLFTEAKETHTGSDHFHFARFGYNATRFAGSVATERYQKGNVYLYADGRAEWLRWSDVQEKLARRGERFVHPEGNP
jgi:prepilin-type N-terminal cleavage/methylation domain-containing protein